MSEDRTNRERDRRDAARALRVGTVLAVLGFVFVFSPFVWGPRFTWNKYFVVVGLILALAGTGMLLNGGLDWLRSKRRS